MQIIEIFINELSWDDKKYDSQNISQEINHFREVLSLIIQKRREYKQIELFINLDGLKGENGFFDNLDLYEEELNKQTVQNIKQRIYQSKNWQTNGLKQHKGEDNFYYLNLNEATLELVNGSSLAEIAHRKIAQSSTQFLLINFSNSRFQHEKFLSIIKNTYSELPQLVHIEQIESIKDLKK